TGAKGIVGSRRERSNSNLMKTTITSHRRIKTPAIKSRGNGSQRNGQKSTKRSTPRISSSVANWLKRPKLNLIGGKWVPAASGKTFDVFDPADASVVARVPDSDKEDISRAVGAARRAFESGPWRRLTSSERGRLIWRIGDLILQHADELAELESLD